MKRLSFVAIAAIAALAFAIDKIKVEPKFEKDQKTKLKSSFKVKLGDIQADLTGTIVVTTKSVEGDVVKQVYDWEDAKAVLNGEEQEVPFAPTEVVLNKNGELQEATGGINGTDTVRTFLLGFIHFPTGELEKDGKWSAKYPKGDKMDLSERTVEGTYLGEEEVAGKKAHKFTTVMTEGSFKATMTYWTTLEGRILKFSTEYTGLPVPIAGGEGEGTFTAEAVD